MKNSEGKINCLTCRHLYITWDKDFPRGCKAMEYKSKTMPSIVASESSGMTCQRFEPKKREKK